MSIEAARTAVDALPVHPRIIASLRVSARLSSTHYSTQIEGNRLALAEVEQVLSRKSAHIRGRQRDEDEVRNYYMAAEKAEALARLKRSFRLEDLQLLHGMAMNGKSKPTPFRDGQNVIRDSGSGGLVYMPPEAKDVALLMEELVAWIVGEIEQGRLPAPIIAALAHYQFATIHPYYDGNGRTSRLMATMILHRCGYGLKGIYSLEEYYARNLNGYYEALSVGPSHNYYFGRAEADVTGFVAYFCQGMADAFTKVRHHVESVDNNSPAGESSVASTAIGRELTPMQRHVLGAFAKSKVLTVAEISAALGISQRQSRTQCAAWLQEGFFVLHNSSSKARSYRLAEPFEALVHPASQG